MLTVAIIPARMGSKRLPRKNALHHRARRLAGAAGDRLRLEAASRRDRPDVRAAADDCARVLRFHATPSRARARRAASDRTPHDLADISTAVAHAVEGLERCLGRIGLVVTLQPAVLARSALIVRQVVQAVVREDAGGAVTAARTVPWQWTVRGCAATNAWHPGPYPRSQHAGHHLAEINAVQVATRAAVAAGQRWGLPLLLAELPPWAAALDIDEPADLAMARDLWPWAKPRLETWEPIIHRADSHQRGGRVIRWVTYSGESLRVAEWIVEERREKTDRERRRRMRGGYDIPGVP
jgi:CMP-N-acetylneuraminic acid synthetase